MMNQPDTTEPARVRNGRRIHDLCSTLTRESLKRAQAALADIGLSPGAYNLLRVLDGQEDMTIADIRKTLRVESATVSTLVMRMQRDGLIQKEPSSHDKRASVITSTPHAATLLRRASEVMAVEASDMTHRLAEGEQIQLIALLEKVLANLSSDP